ncbi:Hsp70 family protein, partial [Actinomycetospora atypica]
MSGYRLGIDLGTTYTAAAISRRTGSGETWSEPEIVPLGSRSASVASVLYLGADGTELLGEAAERRALTEPDRVVRQVKRRIGDDVPLVVGDAVHTAHELAARMARRVTDKTAEREGGPADLVAVTHPASWGEHKRELLAGALREVGLGATTFLPEPQAAAVAYAAKERVESGDTVAVYDLGGGTFDAAVVRKTAQGFELPGRAEGIEQLGGVDFDDRVVDHARAGIGAAFDELDPEDPDVLSALTRLRRECVEAKEALSSDTEVTIPVMLPSVRTNVRLTRHEFEAMIRSSIDHTVGALTRTVDSAGLSPTDLQAVLLVGGSSRIPLVAQMVSEALGRPVAVDADPKTSIAVGAVLAVAPRSAPARARSTRDSASGVPNAAAAAAVTSTVARSDRATPGSPSSGLLDLRSVASPAPAPASRPTRTGSSSGRPPVTGPGSARFPAVGPSSGRLPVAPARSGTGPTARAPRTGTGPALPSGGSATP